MTIDHWCLGLVLISVATKPNMLMSASTKIGCYPPGAPDANFGEAKHYE